jgi:hypothetical protein
MVFRSNGAENKKTSRAKSNVPNNEKNIVLAMGNRIIDKVNGDFQLKMKLVNTFVIHI